MLGNLTTKEALQLSRRIRAWKTKNKKSWAQAALDFSVSRTTLAGISKGSPCRVDTARKISKVIRWKAFRNDQAHASIWKAEDLQRASSSGGLKACPLLRLQTLHAVASWLYLRVRLKGYLVQLALPDHTTTPLLSEVILPGPAKLPLISVIFYIRERALKYQLKRYMPDGASHLVGDGYLSDEGIEYCEEFMTSYLTGMAAQTPRQRSADVFNALHNGKRKRPGW